MNTSRRDAPHAGRAGQRSVRPARLLLLGACLLLLASLARAVGGYDLSWWTVDGGGGGSSQGEGYALGGTAGQADAGILEGPHYRLTGGFWAGAVRPPVYLPLVLRNSR